MRKTIKALLLAGMVSIAPSFAATASAEGLVTIIVNDPSNPYWFTEGEVASKTAKELGYDATVGAHRGDTNTEPGLHPVLRQRGLDHWARRLAHVRADIPVVINEYDAGSDVREQRRQPRGQLAGGLDAGQPSAHHDRGRRGTCHHRRRVPAFRHRGPVCRRSRGPLACRWRCDP